MYIDESKRDGYLMVGVIIDAADVRDARRALTSLLLPGQQRIHFHAESDGRRRSILAVITQLSIRAVAVQAPTRLSAKPARRACLDVLAQFAIQNHVTEICLERDDSMDQLDRDVLMQRTSETADMGSFSLRLLRASQEPLLWTADAIAWAYPQRGSWRQSVESLIIP